MDEKRMFEPLSASERSMLSYIAELHFTGEAPYRETFIQNQKLRFENLYGGLWRKRFENICKEIEKLCDDPNVQEWNSPNRKPQAYFGDKKIVEMTEFACDPDDVLSGQEITATFADGSEARIHAENIVIK